MPDRQQNINIKFQSNAVDLQRASELLNKAKQANDALNASINKTGTEGKAKVQQFSNTIAGLTLQMQQLKAQIDLTNQADTQRLTNLRSQYSALQAQLSKYQGTIETQNKSIIDGLGGIYSAVRLALTAGLIKETVTATIEMARLKGQMEGVSKAFNALPNATLLMEDLRKKTHGTLDDLTLMQKAVQAKNFKIPLEQLGNLLEFAAVKAQQTGIDINYLVDSIITGLGRNSIKILDNLQFSVTELREKTKELGSTQAAVFFLVNKQMKEMGGFVETDAQKVDRLDAAWKNLKITLSGKISSGGFIDVLNKAVEGARLLLMTQKEIDAESAKTAAAGQAEQFTSNKPSFMATQAEISRAKELLVIRKTDLALEEQQAALFKANPDLSEVEKGKRMDMVRARIDALKMQNLTTTAYVHILEQYQESLNRVIPKEEEEAKAVAETNKELEKSLITRRSLRQEIELQIEQIQKRLETSLARPTKGGSPDGGFMGPLGAADTSSKNTPSSDADVFKTWYDNYATFWDKLKQGFDDLGLHIHKGAELTVEDQRRLWQNTAKEIGNAISTIFKEQLTSFNAQEVQSLDARLKNTQDFYDAQIELAGDNQNRVSALRRKEQQEITKLQRERDQAARRQARTQIIINTAASIVKALVETPWPYDLVLAAVYAGMGASQLAVLNRAPAGYAKGVINLRGPGTGTSDSIPARLSKGESVMTAEETRSSMGLLKAIRAKRIDDKMIDEIIAKTGGATKENWDADKIVSAIKSQPKPPDFFKVGNQIYEVKQLSDTSKRYVRRSFLG